MNRSKFNEIRERFHENENRLKSLKVNQKIYETDLHDPIGFSYFEHEVTSVDLEEMCVITVDNSQGKKVSKLYSFYLGNEIGLPDF